MSYHLLQILHPHYTQLGGLRLVRQYAKMGVLWPMVKAMPRNPLNCQSYKNAYAVVLRLAEKLQHEKYWPVMRESVSYKG